jgi:hypothetical protein
VRCPRCGELAPEGAAICDACDEILDASFLGLEDEEPAAAGDKTDVGAAPRGPTDLRPSRLRKAPSSRGSWEPRRPAVPAQAGSPLTPRKPYLASQPAAAAPSAREEAQRTARDLGSFVRSLTQSDRWALGSSAALLAMMAFPWRWTREDDEIIGVVAAWPVGLFAAAVVLFIYVRSTRAHADLDRRLRLAQVAASALSAISCGLFLPWVTESHALRAAGKTIPVALSSPQVGAYLGLVCAVSALFASVPALRE